VNSIFKEIFSSGIQAMAVQVLGIFFFSFISVYLSKENFGLVSWANACGIFLTLSWIAGAYLFHMFASYAIMLLSVFIVYFIFSNSFYGLVNLLFRKVSNEHLISFNFLRKE
jgi:hypothetical protein